jgi:hypothetical protein
MKKIFAVFAALIVALAVVGFTYASWFSSIDINANINTGKLELSITDFWKNNETGYSTITSSDAYPTNAITLTINNTYPGWNATAFLRVKNTGTIPLVYYSFGLQRTGGYDYLMDFYQLGFAYFNGASYVFNLGPNDLRWFEGGPWLYKNYFLSYPVGFVLQPGEVHDNMLYFGLRNTLTDYMDITNALQVKFTLTATQYVP